MQGGGRRFDSDQLHPVRWVHDVRPVRLAIVDPLRVDPQGRFFDNCIRVTGSLKSAFGGDDVKWSSYEERTVDALAQAGEEGRG